MLISSFLGLGTLFYVGNYTLYRYYFKKPLNFSNFKGIVRRDLRHWAIKKFIITLKQNPYQVEFKFGINHKPISSKYIQEFQKNENSQFQYYTLFMRGQNGSYQHLTKNNQKSIADFEEGMDQLLKQNYNSDYFLVSLHHNIDEMHNIYQVRVEKQQFINQNEDNSIQLLMKDYVYIFMKKNDEVIICQHFGNNTKDIDYIDRIINHTIKNEKQINYINLTEQWFQENKQYIQCMLKLDDKYQLIKIKTIDGYQICSGNQQDLIYQTILDNIKNKLIQYL